jgi:hypothetical protein
MEIAKDLAKGLLFKGAMSAMRQGDILGALALLALATSLDG